MKRTCIRILVACLLPASLAHCGAKDGGELPLNDLAEAASLAWCAKAYDCCTDLELQDFAFESGAECKIILTQALDQYWVTPLQSAIGSGRGRYDAKKASACMEAFMGLGCVGTNNPQDFFEQCDSPWTALQTAGQDCASLFECVAGTYCSQASDTCTTPAAENESCAPGQDPLCQAALFCDGTQCVQRKAADADCTEDGECQLGLECTQARCAPIPPKCTGRT